MSLKPAKLDCFGSQRSDETRAHAATPTNNGGAQHTPLVGVGNKFFFGHIRRLYGNFVVQRPPRGNVKSIWISTNRLVCQPLQLLQARVNSVGFSAVEEKGIGSLSSGTKSGR